MKHKRISVQIDPKVYTAAAVTAKSRSVLVGDVIEEALRQHEGVARSLEAMGLVDRAANAHVQQTHQDDDLGSLRKDGEP